MKRTIETAGHKILGQRAGIGTNALHAYNMTKIMSIKTINTTKAKIDKTDKKIEKS